VLYNTYDVEAPYVSDTGMLKILKQCIPVKRPKLRIKLPTDVVKLLFTKLEMDTFILSYQRIYLALYETLFKCFVYL